MLRKRLHKLGIRTGFQRRLFGRTCMREGAMILCEEQNKKSNVGTISYLPGALRHRLRIGRGARRCSGEMEDSGKRESND